MVFVGAGVAVSGENIITGENMGGGEGEEEEEEAGESDGERERERERRVRAGGERVGNVGE